VIFDDGLQSFEISPDITIGLINDRVGNGLRLPAGPLRAPWSTFNNLDILVPVGAGRGFYKKNVDWVYHHYTKSKRFLASFSKVSCLFGLGDPRLLEEFLRSQSFSYHIEYLPDHGRCSLKDLRYYLDAGDVFMTEKDWVKYRDHLKNSDRLWILPLEGQIDERVKNRIFEMMRRKGLCFGV
jgi:tetraacyldisaccharide-1-P 4'-kinase